MASYDQLKREYDQKSIVEVLTDPEFLTCDELIRGARLIIGHPELLDQPWTGMYGDQIALCNLQQLQEKGADRPTARHLGITADQIQAAGTRINDLRVIVDQIFKENLDR